MHFVASRVLATCFWIFYLPFFSQERAFAQERNQFDPKSLEIGWYLVKNNHPGSNQFTATLTLKSDDKKIIPNRGWRLLFNLRYHGTVLTSNTPAVEIKHVSGDLFAIHPTDVFKHSSGDTVVMEYHGNRIIANFQDVPSGLIWINDHEPEIGIDLGRVKIISSSSDGFEKLPVPDHNSIFNQNKLVQEIAIDQLPTIFPTAKEYQQSTGSFSLDADVQIVADRDFLKQAEYLSRELEKIFRKKISVKSSQHAKTIFIKKVTMSREAYRLKVAAEQVVVEAADPAGVFYAIQSIKSMLPPDVWQNKYRSIPLPCVLVNDAPRFPFRAFMLDVARNFQPKEEILKVLDLMSLYKLNVFHFHFSDDEGWRLEIPGLPELTDVGAKRGFPFEDNNQLHPSYGSGTDGKSHGNGFYSRADYLEILRYATDRHIRVVPEIESPGHAGAAIKAMQYRYKKLRDAGKAVEATRFLLQDTTDQSEYLSSQYFRDNVMDVAMPSTYTFIEKVIDEIVNMYREAGAPLAAIHMAGDEVPHGSWEKSPTANAFMKTHPDIVTTKDLWRYYFNQVKKILHRKGLSIYGWQELVMGTQNPGSSVHTINLEFLNDDVQVDAWWNLYGNEDVPYKLANAGYKTVLTFFDHFYFDLSYQRSFDEPGDGWIGILDIDKTYSFVPYDYYKSTKTNIRGEPLAADFFKEKEKLNDRGTKNIVGIQGALWGENLISSELMEYLLMPRLMALAERAWAQDPVWARDENVSQSEVYNKSWSIFANVLGKRELPKLDHYNGGFGYRIPTPGAAVLDGKVNANMQLPGFTIRYTLDGSLPDGKSKIYVRPIEHEGVIKLSAFDGRGRSGKTITVLNQ